MVLLLSSVSATSDTVRQHAVRFAEAFVKWALCAAKLMQDHALVQVQSFQLASPFVTLVPDPWQAISL